MSGIAFDAGGGDDGRPCKTARSVKEAAGRRDWQAGAGGEQQTARSEERGGERIEGKRRRAKRRPKKKNTYSIDIPRRAVEVEQCRSTSVAAV